MKNSKGKKRKDCFDCEQCLYICEGDYICTLGEPKIVLTEFTSPTGDFVWCIEENRK